VVRKRLRLKLDSENTDAGRVYRIVAPKPKAKAKAELGSKAV
jgi:hypothetical protein